MVIRQLLNVIFYRAIAELRAEATRTWAGYAWWIIQPLLGLAVYYVAFSYILSRKQEDYVMFLFIGIVLWQWFQLSVQRCSMALVVSQGLMQQVDLHKSVFPLSIVLVNTVKFSVTLVLLLAVLIFSGHHVTLAWLGIIPLLLLELLLIVGTSCAVAAISPFFPDFEPILGNILQMMFFLSGIFYDLSNLPAKLAVWLAFNPMAVLIMQFRKIVLEAQWPAWNSLLTPLVISLVILTVSLAVIHRYDKVYPKLG